MSAEPPKTLRSALIAAGPRPGASLRAAEGTIELDAIAHGTSLGDARPALAGRSVLLLTTTQRAAALAMVDLDGLVARMMVCPPDLKAEHRLAVIRDAALDAVVTDADDPALADLGLPVFRCDWPLTPLAEAPAPRATEWVLATSGTSGAPKLVVHTLQALTAAIAPVPADRPLVWGTFYDIRRYGGMQIFLRAMLAGCPLVLSSAGEALPSHLDRLAAAGITHLSGTPSHWRRLLMSAEAGRIAPATVRLSGEIADQAVLDSLAETYPQARIGHAYASTEAGVGFEVTDGLEGFPAAYLDGAVACDMRVEDGSLRMRSNRMASRYLGTDAAPLTDAGGFVDTGDMVEQRGERLYFVGRRGGIINVGGLKVHPEEIEAVINRHAEVRMSLVRSRRSPITGAIVVADVVLTEAADPARLREEIMRDCRASLPSHKIPATLRFVTSIEVTAAGKLARSA